MAVGFGLFAGALQLLTWLGGATGAESTGMSMMFMTIVWTIVAAVISGFVTAVLAGSHEMPHASGVGLLMIGLSLLSMRQESLPRPSWYQTAIAGCGPISVMIGAAIRMLWRVRQAVKAKTSAAASRS